MCINGKFVIHVKIVEMTNPEVRLASLHYLHYQLLCPPPPFLCVNGRLFMLADVLG